MLFAVHYYYCLIDSIRLIYREKQRKQMQLDEALASWKRPSKMENAKCKVDTRTKETGLALTEPAINETTRPVTPTLLAQICMAAVDASLQVLSKKLRSQRKLSSVMGDLQWISKKGGSTQTYFDDCLQQ